MRNLFLTFLCFCLWACLFSSCSNKNDSFRENTEGSLKALENLKKELSNADLYSRIRSERIDSLKVDLSQTTDPLEMSAFAVSLASEYRQFNSDSAIYYASLAGDVLSPEAPDSSIVMAKLSLVKALSTSGIFPEAIRKLEETKPIIKDYNSKIEYWRSSRILYSSLLDFLKNDNDFFDEYRFRYMESDDSLLCLLPPSHPFHQFINAERLVTRRKWDQAQKQLESILENNPLESNIFGMSAFQLAEVYKNTGDFNNYEKYLALASLSDVKGAVKEGMALPTLASYLYEKGDIDNAFTFITTAFNDASHANIRMRTVALADNMAIIDKSYREQINDSRGQMLVFLIIASTLLLVAFVLLAIIIRNIRSSKEKEQKLAQSTAKLHSYISNFIGLSSSYASRFDQMLKLIRRKISAGQTDDLLKLLESGRFSLDDNDEFYRLIDKAILDIYPDFVDRLNTLLVPEKRISLNEGKSDLTPEVRIYAFVRLGVDQSSKIAQILHYSVNTVYAYRNRMRNRALDKDNFDSQVASLDMESGL